MQPAQPPQGMPSSFFSGRGSISAIQGQHALSQRRRRHRRLQPGCLGITQLHGFSEFFHCPKLTALVFFFLNVTQKQWTVLCIFETPVCNHIAFHETSWKLVSRSYLASQKQYRQHLRKTLTRPAGGRASLSCWHCGAKGTSPFLSDSTPGAGNTPDHACGCQQASWLIKWALSLRCLLGSGCPGVPGDRVGQRFLSQVSKGNTLTQQGFSHSFI